MDKIMEKIVIACTLGAVSILAVIFIIFEWIK